MLFLFIDSFNMIFRTQFVSTGQTICPKLASYSIAILLSRLQYKNFHPELDYQKLIPEIPKLCSAFILYKECSIVSIQFYPSNSPYYHRLTITHISHSELGDRGDTCIWQVNILQIQEFSSVFLWWVGRDPHIQLPRVLVSWLCQHGDMQIDRQIKIYAYSYVSCERSCTHLSQRDAPLAIFKCIFQMQFFPTVFANFSK